MRWWVIVGVACALVWLWGLSPMQEPVVAPRISVVEKPIEPRVDAIWHLIPGYDGVMRVRTKSGRSRLQPMQPRTDIRSLRAEPIYRGNPNKPMVYLIINVAWGDSYIPHILGSLRKHGARATFFLDGKWLASHMDTAKIILRAGHLLGNHGYTHRNMSTLTQEEQTQEIEKTNTLLRQTGTIPTFFAPPSGDFAPSTLGVASMQGMFTVLWTIDTIDWWTSSADAILARVVPRLEPGSIILMHPTASAAAALDRLLDAIAQKHLQLGTAEDLVRSARVAND